MRRLLQFATVTFLLVTVLMPVLECFDHWDVAGLSNDTEFGCFATVLLLCLVLLVSVAVAAWSRRSQMAERDALLKFADLVLVAVWRDQTVAAVAPTGTPPPLLVPLRI